jgi:hypothetical protein
VVAALSPAAQALVPPLFLRLVTAGRTRARRSREELAAALGGGVGGPLESLVRGRLLAVDGSAVQVAHEALLEGWPRLKVWLDEAAGERVVLERLELAAADWERLARPPDLLWRGRQLDEVSAVARSPLTPREAEFVDRSFRAARRTQVISGCVTTMGHVVATQGCN